MQNYKHINGEYSPEESLQIDKDKLSDALIKLNRKLNPIAKEHYEAEVIELTESIKNRKDYILTNK